MSCAFFPYSPFFLDYWYFFSSPPSQLAWLSLHYVLLLKLPWTLSRRCLYWIWLHHPWFLGMAFAVISGSYSSFFFLSLDYIAFKLLLMYTRISLNICYQRLQTTTGIAPKFPLFPIRFYHLRLMSVAAGLLIINNFPANTEFRGISHHGFAQHLQTTCKLWEVSPDVFALNRISFLIHSGRMFSELKQFQVDGGYVVSRPLSP